MALDRVGPDTLRCIRSHFLADRSAKGKPVMHAYWDMRTSAHWVIQTEDDRWYVIVDTDPATIRPFTGNIVQLLPCSERVAALAIAMFTEILVPL